MLRGPAWQNWDMSLQKNIDMEGAVQTPASRRLLQHLQPSQLRTSELSDQQYVYGRDDHLNQFIIPEARTVEFAAKFSF